MNLTRRQIRASMLSAMATTLGNDAFGTGAGYLYDEAADLPDRDRRIHQRRVEAVARELIAEFSRRADRLGR